MKTSQLDYLIVYPSCCVCVSPTPYWWIGKTFWQVIQIIDLECVGDYAYYEVTMPLPPYPRITCLLQDVTALAFHKGTDAYVLCVLLLLFFTVCSVLGELQDKWMNGYTWPTIQLVVRDKWRSEHVNQLGAWLLKQSRKS